MKILIAYLSDSNDTREFSTGILPSGIFPIGTALEKEGHEVIIANFSHIGHSRALHKIIDIAPDIAAFSLLTHNRTDTIRLTREIKKNDRKIITVLGGPHASAMAHAIAKRYTEIDHIVTGDGVKGMTRLVHILSGGIKGDRIIDGTSVIPDVGSVSECCFQGKTIGVNTHEQFKFISSGNFCSAGSILTRYSGANVIIPHRPDAIEIVNKIEHFYRTHGIIYFSFRDESFAADKSLICEVSREIIRRRLYVMWNCQAFPAPIDSETLICMKNAGCERIILSAESGSDKILDILETGSHVQDIISSAALIRKAGLYLTLFLRVGINEENLSDIRKTNALIRKTLPGEGIIAPAVYYPGTVAWEKAVRDQLIDENSVFNSKGQSLYLRSDPEVRRWMEEIHTAFSLT
ncbi:MAG TPA: cobalamin-dependent protein, partial [Spirochaetota bacterium]